MKLIFLVVFLIFSFTSCIIFIEQPFTKKHLRCVDEEVKILQTDPEYIKVRQAFLDTLEMWQRMKLRLDIRLRYYDPYKWRLDSMVFFNAGKTKCLLSILIFNPPAHTFDNVQLISGEKIKNEWQFYYLGLPTYMYDRKEGKKELTERELSVLLGRKPIVTDGYYKGCGCEKNDSYIDKWLTKDNIVRMHFEFFLKNK